MNKLEDRLKRLSTRICALSVAATLAGGAAAVPQALAAGDANEAVCPNEASPGFRRYLADCRAYEMVSPPYKQGFPVETTGYASNDLASGAPLVTGISFGAFAGAPDVEEVNEYLFRRTASGWQTTAIDPQPSQYVLTGLGGGRGALAIGEDGSALMRLHTPTESIYASGLYRRSVDGALSLVGPMLPPSAVPPAPTGLLAGEEGLSFAGAASNFSHVLFYIRALVKGELPPGVATNLWPGDTTVPESGQNTRPQSLYEYTGSGNAQPTLVGVDNTGHLISQCGTALGGLPGSGPIPEGNSHNAVAAGGTRVFFTASPACPGAGENGPGAGPPVYELFARINAEDTVAISQPTPGDCATCDLSSPADANFEGASQDGTKVLFTTTQPLLPGDSGKNLYEYDFNREAKDRIVQVSSGAPVPAVQGVAAVSPDGSHIYFVAQGVLAGKNGEGNEPTEGAPNLYVSVKTCAGGEADCAHPTARTSFVATLAEADAGQWNQSANEPMNVTPDGRFLVFTSTAKLTPEDTSTEPQVFRYDSQNGILVRASIGEQGYNHDGNTEVNHALIPRTAFSGGEHVGVDTHPAVSSDGSVVVFESSDALTSQAAEEPTNPIYSVYEYRGGHVYLISDGRTATGEEGHRGAFATGVSPSGQDIFFRTFGSLLPQDTDSLADVYDARVAGGFPGATESGACSGESCQSPSSLSPTLGTPATATEPSGANLAPPPNTPTPQPNHKISTKEALKQALKACKKKPRRQRAACETRAKRRYAAKGKKSKRAGRRHP